MEQNDLNNFIDKMKETIYRAGEITLKHQGKVRNSGKEIEKLSADNDFFRQQRAAKTIMDDQVQEELLLAASKLLNAPKIYLDAEEETASTKYFSPKPTSTTLVIDPIDGTLRYLSGEDDFGICVGLIEGGVVLTALVYLPARKEFYFIKNGHVYCEINGKLQKLSPPKAKNNHLIYINNRVSDQIVENLIQEGFKVVNDNDADGFVSMRAALIKCIKGEYSACIFHSPQVRDILLGAMISKISDGYARNWTGNEIVWPDGGRIPQIIFGFNPLPEKILACLKV